MVNSTNKLNNAIDCKRTVQYSKSQQLEAWKSFLLCVTRVTKRNELWNKPLIFETVSLHSNMKYHFRINIQNSKLIYKKKILVREL